jgi:hypothetical protein
MVSGQLHASDTKMVDFRVTGSDDKEKNLLTLPAFEPVDLPVTNHFTDWGILAIHFS